VANAIFDGSDAVMLSAETSIGEYPVQTVLTMARIIEEAEQATNGLKLHQRRSLEHGLTIPDAISCAACEAAQQLEASAIVAFTTSGFTARMVSKNRPGTPIIVFTFSDNVQRQLNLLWGVTPIKLDLLYSTDEIISQTEKVLLEKNIVEKGDIVVILMGAPIYSKGTTNLLKLHVIGESI
jgi:pyruvate kinase